MTDFMALSLASLVRSRGFVGVSMENFSQKPHYYHYSITPNTPNTIKTLFIGKIIKNQEINILLLLQIHAVVEN